MKDVLKALESAFRAGLKQWRRMRTLQRQAALPDPLQDGL